MAQAEGSEDIRGQLESLLSQQETERHHVDHSELIEKSKLTLDRLKSEFTKLSVVQFSELSASRKKLSEVDRQVFQK